MWKLLVTVIFALFLSVPAVAQSVHDAEPAETNQADTSQEPTPQESSTPDPVAVAESSETLDTEEPDNQANAHQDDVPETSLEDKDHIAQIWMNKAAWAQAALTLLGVFLVWRTLKHSKDAAKAADSAAEAAWATAMEAEKTRESQLRAYIAIEGLGIMDNEYHKENKPPTFYINLRNAGQTPAKNVKIYSQFAARSNDIKGEPKFHFKKHIDGDVIPITLGPNFPHSIKADYRQDISEAQRKAMWDTEQFTCYCAIVVTYEDIFGKTRRTMAKAKMVKLYSGYAALPVSNHNKMS